MTNYNRNAFLAQFGVSIEALAQSEAVTKRELRDLSRTVLLDIIEKTDVAIPNRLLTVLTPVNRKVAVMFFKEFSGLAFDENTGTFTGKAKKRWDESLAKAKEFLADPMNNIWTWAERNVEVTKKEFSLDQVTEAFKTFTKKAQKANLTQKDVIKAVLASGVELDTILALMGEVYDMDVDVKA